MNSAINPLGSSPQATVAGNQGMMHTNTNVAHSHPNQHHYSLNNPNTTGHYTNQNMGQIPASNHPIANPSATAAGQGYNPQKNASNFMGNYEENLTHQQNQNAFPPVSQALPATVLPQSNANTTKTTPENLEQTQVEKPQSNGTAEVKSPQKIESASSFSLTPKEKSVQPAPVPQLSQVQDKVQEKPAPVPASIPTPVPASIPSPVAAAIPTPVPASTPTPVSTSIATPVSTSVPTPAPTSVPTPAATSVSTPATTSVPTPAPTSVSTPASTSAPTQLKLSETSNSSPKVQTSVSPATINSKPSPTTPTTTSEPQRSEKAPTTTTSNSSLPAHVENKDNKDVPQEAASEIKEPETKKPKVEENLAPTEQPENLKVNKPTDSDTEAKLESKEEPEQPQSAEPAVANNEEKVSLKEKPSPPKEESSPSKPTSTPNATSNETPATKTPIRKPKTKADEISNTPKTPKVSPQKSPSTSKAKRQRLMTQHYQSPLPEVELINKISSQSQTPRTPRSNDDKLIVFYKNEFLAVRNAEGGFYLCQAVQNIYRSSSKIKIRWLSQDKNDKSGEVYIPDFYDLTDFDCILTNLSLNKIDKKTFRLPPSEKERTQSILNRSLAVEKGEVTSPSLTEEHPDGLDLSLYKAEDQLKKRKGTKRKAGRKPANRTSAAKKEIPTKKSPEAPKVRKVASPPPAKKLPAKIITTDKKPVAQTAKKPAAQPAKKPVVQPAKKPVPAQPEAKKTVPSTNRVSGRGKRKAEIKISPVVDQKKAKVLAKIGKKTAVPAAKSVPANKNAKSGTKTATSSKKAPQTKTNSSASSKPPPPRNTRRSTRK